MESTLQKPLVAAGSSANFAAVAYWIATALFCLQIGFTAYAQLALAAALRDAGQTQQSDQALERCRTIARDLRMTRLLELVDEATLRMS